MNSALRQEIELFVVSLALMLLLGFFSGHVAAFLIAGMLLYILWNFYNLRRLTRWLASPSKQLPGTPGVWGDVYYQLYQLYRRQRKAKRKLASILTRFQESTQALPYATIVLNSNREIEWFNNAAKKMFDLSSGHDIGQRIENLVRLPAFIRYIEKGKFNEPLELALAHQQGRLSITPYGNGQFLLGAHDITQRKQLETMRRDFIANASHELRTPLTVIAGYLEAIQGNDALDSASRNALAQAYQQAQRMESMLHDMIALSRLEASAMPEKTEVIEVDRLMREVFSDIQAIDRGRHRLELVTTPARISGDAEELRMVINNLMTNAIRYTDDGVRVVLANRIRNEQVCIEVADSGEGIAREHLSRLTERFYRVDQGRSRDRGGTGLGLAIVKHILDRHNARLEIESRVGDPASSGSTFRCCFPLDENDR